jgi:hypothetical protein
MLADSLFKRTTTMTKLLICLAILFCLIAALPFVPLPNLRELNAVLQTLVELVRAENGVS